MPGLSWNMAGKTLLVNSTGPDSQQTRRKEVSKSLMLKTQNLPYAASSCAIRLRYSEHVRGGGLVLIYKIKNQACSTKVLNCPLSLQ